MNGKYIMSARYNSVRIICFANNACKFVFVSDLNTSSLLCDCQLQWLAKWLIDNRFQQSCIAVCAHPASLAGSSVFVVKPEEFICSE